MTSSAFAIWPYVVTALLLFAVVLQGCQRSRRIKSGFPVKPMPSPLQRDMASQGPGEWLRRAAIVLTLLIAAFLVWHKSAVYPSGYKEMIPAIFAGGLALWAVLDWFRRGASSSNEDRLG